jgi:hypothetical protein
VRHPGYLASQRTRKRIEEAFVWIETIAGQAQARPGISCLRGRPMLLLHRPRAACLYTIYSARHFWESIRIMASDKMHRTQTYNRIYADNRMPMKSHLELAQHQVNVLGNLHVSSGRHGVAGWMIIRQCHRMDMELQRSSCDLATVGRGLIEGSPLQAFFEDETVPSSRKSTRSFSSEHCRSLIAA